MPTQSAPPMTTVTPRQVPNVLEALISDQFAFFLIGKPGIGKTQMVAQTLDRMGLSMIDVRGATMDPVDARGVPFIKDGMTHWARPDMWPTQGNGCIFFDEFNRSVPQVQNALMNVIHDRRIAGHVIPNTWTTGAAGNDIDTGVHKMGDALRDRFTFLNVVVDNDDWVLWAIQSGRIEPIVIAFLRFQPHLLSGYAKDALVNPTPRSWERASKLISRQYPKDVQHALLAGTVGEEAAVKFGAFEPVYRQMPSVDAILADPTRSPVPGADQPGLRVAIASALGMRMTEANLGQALTYLGRMPGEYGAFATSDAVARDVALSHTLEYLKYAAENNIAAVH